VVFFDADLKLIYSAANLDGAEYHLELFRKKYENSNVAGPWKVWSDGFIVLARQARFCHGAYRVQRRVAVRVAAAVGRGSFGVCVGANSKTEFI
jgi:hypothetical protein